MRDMWGAISRTRLIETDVFPFEFLSTVAERESWRKEIYRPIYHIHKWWAKRLGSVFRGILLGCLLPDDGDLEAAFYQSHDFQSVCVFDPFMGSGTTLGEAHKLGCTVLGRDINPVACETVRIAFGPLERHGLQDAFAQLSETVGIRLQQLYKAPDDSGLLCDVLYYFWVKWITCPHCSSPVDLFSSRIFARNAYPDRKPEVRVCCPFCNDIFVAHNGDKKVHCPHCGKSFDPAIGSANGSDATCVVCSRSFAVAEAVRQVQHPPHHRLYAKLLLSPDGRKQYLPATLRDMSDYEVCQLTLAEELKRGDIRLPSLRLADGHNTRQAMGYAYRSWRDFFNDRQLLALGWLQQAIAELPDAVTREAFLLLFSGILEFNNMFASYKGEGTGAVRHMFAHHVLKPERTPIEANVWGTPKSSGSFSNLYKTRLLRAVEYRDAPFEATIQGSGKAYRAAKPFTGALFGSWPVNGNLRERSIYLSCGSSDETGLPDKLVDLVVTDPPFFDNVHYSELADFFFAWQTLFPRGFVDGAATTRDEREVQDTDPDRFAQKLRAVFTECARVLKDDGLLVFTYHHSRQEGWTSLIRAIYGAGFKVINAHPVRAEMTVAAPKSQAKEPIQLDIVLVCRKRGLDAQSNYRMQETLEEAVERALRKLHRLTSIGLTLSQNDRRIIFVGQFVAGLDPMADPETAVSVLLEHEAALDGLARRSAAIETPVHQNIGVGSLPPQQYPLWPE
jgi:putative DNA methylase